MNMFERKPKPNIIPETETKQLEKLESVLAAARLGGGVEPMQAQKPPKPPTPEEIEKAAALELGIEAARQGGGI